MSALAVESRRSFSQSISRRLCLATFAVLAIAGIAPADTTPSTQPTDVFVGLWAITATPDNVTAQRGVQAFSDRILFEENKLTAEACAKYGLAPSSYALNVSPTSGRTFFTSSMSSDTQGSISWTGYLNSSGIRGKMIWTKADGSVSTYRYSGNRAQVITEEIPADPEPTDGNP